MMREDPASGASAPHSGVRLAIDYGPLLVFLLVTFVAPGELLLRLVELASISLADRSHVEALLIARVIAATAAFVLATVAALIASQLKLGKISPMLWISGALVLVFGGLTIYFRDPHFIKMKPTFVYGIFAAVLTFGLLTGRPLLMALLGNAYPGLSVAGWKALTRNWAIFFLAMAVANEAVWRVTEATLSPDAAFRAWSLYKFPGCLIFTFLFVIANFPMLTRHGLKLGDEAPVPPEDEPVDANP